MGTFVLHHNGAEKGMKKYYLFSYSTVDAFLASSYPSTSEAPELCELSIFIN